MAILNILTRVFWNQDEKRVRALWRLAIHAVLFMMLTSFITVGLTVLAALFRLASGTRLRDVLGVNDLTTLINAPYATMVIAPLAAFLGVLGATFFAGKWLDCRPFKAFGFIFSKRWWQDFAFGLGLGALLMGLIFLVGWLTGSIHVTGFFKAFNQDISFFWGFLQALFFFILVGIYEELLSRGYHLVNLAEGFNGRLFGERGALILAYLVSSLAFGLLHLGNPNATWVSGVNIAMAGVFLGLGMVLTGSLAIPIGLHITWNFFQGTVFGFAVSGIRTGATLIATEATGPAWLTGGNFGPEAGLLGLGAMLIGCVLIIFWVRWKGKLALAEELAVYEPRINRADYQIQSDTPNLAAD